MSNYLLYFCIGTAFGLVVGFCSSFRKLVLDSLGDKIES